MFKFLRKYNKIILVIGAAFLMVAFLIQPVMSMFMTGPGDMPVGTIDGEEITGADQTTAAAELQVLQRVNRVLGSTAMQGMAEGDALKWMLMVRDARRLGLSASRAQVLQILQLVGAPEQEDVNRIAREAGVSDDLVYQAVRHWIMLQEYQSLMLGQEHKSAAETLGNMIQYFNLMQQMRAQGNFQLFQQVMQLRNDMQSSVRLSDPLIEWFIANRQSTVAGELLVIDADYYLDQIDAPTENELQALFDEHRDDAPGEGEPYGFGYKYPDHVKLEWLSFPVDKLRNHVQVDYAEKLAYYDQNKEQFRVEGDTESTTPPATQPGTQPEPAPQYKPFQQVYDTVTNELRTQAAQEMAQEMVSSAQAALLTDARRLEQANGYRTVPDDFQATSLDAVADQIEQEFGVRPEIQRRTADWVATDELSALPGIGGASLIDRRDVNFTSYVQSARELEPDVSNALVALYLQAQLPSRPLLDSNGSRYLFRLTAAQPSHAPESLDEVRDQVARDAKRRKAYDQLEQRTDEWAQRAVSEGFESLAEQAHITAYDMRPTPRREPDRMSGELTVPSLPGVGQSEALVERMFDIAERISDRGRTPLAQAPTEQRSGAVAVDPRLSVAVFRVDEYSPVTRDAYQRQASNAQVASWLSGMMLSGSDDAMSFDAVAKRVGFERTERGDSEDGQPSSPQQPQRRPGQI